MGLLFNMAPSPSSGGEKFVGDGIEDDAGEDGFAVCKRDRNAEARIAVGEIGGAVERIDVPAKFGVAFVAGAFFGGDGVVGEIFGEPLDDGPLGALVGLGDQVGFAFVGNVWRAIELLTKDLPGFLGDFDGGCEIGFCHWEMGCARRGGLRSSRALPPLYHPRRPKGGPHISSHGL